MTLRGHCVVSAAIVALFLGSPVISGLRPLAAQASGLRIVVVEGEDAVNIIQQKTAVAPIVEVRDRNDQPVAGVVVNFAIRGGRASFGGARTLSVTTNLAGRAVAGGLTPTASGAVQISASAAFQGQTAVVAITQTNVMTAAQAAAVSSAAGSGGGGTAAGTSAGAAGGGGGGLSATTIGIIGGAAAGGAVVATKALSGPGGVPYTGQYAGDIVVTGPAPFCGFTERVSGTVVLRIEDPDAASLTGTAEVTETTTTIYNPSCQLPNGSPFEETHKPSISGSPANLGFNFTRDNTFTATNGTTGIRTKTMSFTGSLTGSEVAGVLTNTESNRSTSGPAITASGTTAFPITLR